MIITIPVTQEHIDNGTPRDACGCAVYLAILDYFTAQRKDPSRISISVSAKRILAFEYENPEDMHGDVNGRPLIEAEPGLALKGWLNQYDEDKSGDPFTLKIKENKAGWNPAAT